MQRGKRAKSSMKLILADMEADLPYADSLKYHFGTTTDTWMAYANGSVFESLKSECLDLISNKDLRQQIVRFYDELIILQKESNIRFRNLVDEGSANVLITRFDELWKGNLEQWILENDFSDINYSTDELISEMTPVDYE